MQQLFFKIGIALFLLVGTSAAAILWTSKGADTIPPLVILGIVAAGALAYIYATLQPLKTLTDELDELSRGKLDGRALPAGPDEMGRMSHAINELRGQLKRVANQLDEIGHGELHMGQVESKVMASQRMADADMPIRASHGEIERTALVLTNQLRRLTLQVRTLSKDQLHHSLLNERIPGELGDAFWALVLYLRELSARATQIAQGDLTSFEDGQGDLKNAFNLTVSSLRTIIDEIMQTTLHITTSAEEILMVLRDQDLAASHQASGVEETQRTMETLLSSAKKIAESAQTVFKSAERTQANNRLIADRANELKSHTERIGEILETIKNIADRSDLLALNASLEGLRAGEAGKGFTLVANEMRRLAENIKESVGDVKELLSNIRESALSSVMAIEEGSHLSQRTTESALKISLITQQQQSGTEQVTQSMEELSHLINQGLVGTRQVTSAASELAQLSENVRTLMESYNTSEEPSEGSSYQRPHVSTGQLRAAREAATQRRTDARRSSHGLRRPQREEQLTPTASQSSGLIPLVGRATLPNLGATRSNNSSEPAEAATERPRTLSVAGNTKRSKPNPELNATMRFVVGEELPEGDPMTLDMSKLHPKRPTPQPSYGEVDDLFDELNMNRTPKNSPDESVERTIDAIERQLDRGGASADSDSESDQD